MPECVACGSEISATAMFCRFCGAAVTAQTTPPPVAARWLCGRCGVENLPDDRFCGGCGAPATGRASPTVIVSRVPVAEAVAPAAADPLPSPPSAAAPEHPAWSPPPASAPPATAAVDDGAGADAPADDDLRSLAELDAAADSPFLHAADAAPQAEAAAGPVDARGAPFVAEPEALAAPPAPPEPAALAVAADAEFADPPQPDRLVGALEEIARQLARIADTIAARRDGEDGARGA